MRRLSWLAVAALMLASVAMLVMYTGAGNPAAGDEPVQVAQAPGGGRGGQPEMSEADRARTRDQMIERVLDQAGLTDKEKAAARKTI